MSGFVTGGRSRKGVSLAAESAIVTCWRRRAMISERHRIIRRPMSGFRSMALLSSDEGMASSVTGSQAAAESVYLPGGTSADHPRIWPGEQKATVVDRCSARRPRRLCRATFPRATTNSRSAFCPSRISFAPSASTISEQRMAMLDNSSSARSLNSSHSLRGENAVDQTPASSFFSAGLAPVGRLDPQDASGASRLV